MTLPHEEFVRRFAQHILPLRFLRIRHFGILSSTWKRNKLNQLQSQLKVTVVRTELKTKLHFCPICNTASMITIEVFGNKGPPSIYLTGHNAIPA